MLCSTPDRLLQQVISKEIVLEFSNGLIPIPLHGPRESSGLGMRLLLQIVGVDAIANIAVNIVN